MIKKCFKRLTLILAFVTVFAGSVNFGASESFASYDINKVKRGVDYDTFAANAPVASIIIDKEKLSDPKNSTAQLLASNKYPGFVLSNNKQGVTVDYKLLAYDESQEGAARITPENGMNEFEGDIASFTYKNIAVLPDGSTGDVVITYSNICIPLQTNFGQNKIGEDGTVSDFYTNKAGNKWKYDSDLKRGTYRDDVYYTVGAGNNICTSNSMINDSYKDSVYSSGTARNGLVVDVNIQVLNSKGEAVNGTFFYYVTDIDIKRSGEYTFEKIAGADSHNNYSESIRIVSGLAEDSDIYVPGPSNKYLSTISADKKGVVISGNTGEQDPGTFFTGFVTVADNNAGLGLTCWAGSGINTGSVNTYILQGLDANTIKSSTGVGGTIHTTAHGNINGDLNDGSTVYSTGTFDIAKGKTVVYTITPDNNFSLGSLSVDGESVVLPENAGDSTDVSLKGGKTGTLKKCADGVYTFTFNENNHDHTIHADWNANRYFVKKWIGDNVPNSLDLTAKAYCFNDGSLERADGVDAVDIKVAPNTVTSEDDKVSSSVTANKTGNVTTWSVKLSGLPVENSKTHDGNHNMPLYWFVTESVPDGFVCDSYDNSKVSSGSHYGGSASDADKWKTAVNAVKAAAYTSVISSDTGTITNIRKISVTAQKIWNDNDDTRNRRTVTFRINSKVGEKETKDCRPAQSITTHKDGSVTWGDLPVYDSSGQQISYSVTEEPVPGYSTSLSTSSSAGGVTNWIFTNTLKSAELAEKSLTIEKILKGRDWRDTDQFKISLVSETHNEPMPGGYKTTNDIRHYDMTFTKTDTESEKHKTSETGYGRLKDLPAITFTAADMLDSHGNYQTEKTFKYHIRELTALESSLPRIPGITYSSQQYEFAVTVHEVNGELKIKSHTCYPITVSGSSITPGDPVEIPDFTNIFNVDSTSFDLTAVKELDSYSPDKELESGDYSFILKPVGDYADVTPMPAGSSGSGSERTYTSTNMMEEISMEGLVFDHNSLVRSLVDKHKDNFPDDKSVDTALKSANGINFEYELYEDVADATNNYDGTYTKYDPQNGTTQIYDGIHHIRRISIKLETIDSVEVLAVHPQTDSNELDYYIGENETIVRINHDTFNKHHTDVETNSSIPLFLNQYKSDTGTVSVTKIWNDEDKSEKRSDVTFTLYSRIGAKDPEEVHFDQSKPGGGTVEPKTISKTAAGNDLTVSWSHLPLKEKSGDKTEAIKYFVIESGADADYKTTYQTGEGAASTEPADAAVTLTKGETSAITVTNILRYPPKGENAVSYGAPGAPQTGTPVFTLGSTTTESGEKNTLVFSLDDSVAYGYDDDGKKIAIGSFALSQNSSAVTFTPDKDHADYHGKVLPVTVTATDGNNKTATATYNPHIIVSTKTKTVTRIIRYEYDHGRQGVRDDNDRVIDEEKQTVTLSLTGKVNPNNGSIIWEESAWTADEGALPATAKDVALTKDGYIRTIVGAEKSKIDAISLTTDDTLWSNEDDIVKDEVLVLFTPDGPSGENQTSIGSKGAKQTASINIEPASGTMGPGPTNNTITFMLLDSSYNKVTEVTVEGKGKFTIDSSTGKISFQPVPEYITAKNGAVSVKVIGTDKNYKSCTVTYTPEVREYETEKTVNRKIRYIDNKGVKVFDDVNQSASFIAVGELTQANDSMGSFSTSENADILSGKDIPVKDIHYIKWKDYNAESDEYDLGIIPEGSTDIEWEKSRQSQSFDKVESPSKRHYTPNISVVKAESVKPSDEDKLVEVVYTPDKYNIKFDANGGKGNMPDQEMTWDVADNLNPNKFTREGYTFKGWNTKPDGSGDPYLDQAVVYNFVGIDDEEITLYAQWKTNIYTVTFVDGFGKTLKIEKVKYGGAATAPNDPKKKGYKFKGWDVRFDYITSDLVVTAQWEKTKSKGSSSGDSGNDSVRTGDEENIAGWVSMMLLAGALLTVGYMKRRRENRR